MPRISHRSAPVVSAKLIADFTAFVCPRKSSRKGKLREIGTEGLNCHRRAFWDTAVVGAVLHQGGVTELQIQKPRQIRKGLRHAPGKAGQYCYLNIPELSRYEWHPFSLTSGNFS